VRDRLLPEGSDGSVVDLSSIASIIFRFANDSPLEGGFELVWGFCCQAVVLGCADSFLFGAGKAVFRPVACDQVPAARGGGQGTETLAKLGGLPPSVACVSQRLDA
jgi:hypothetical protein